MHAEPQTWLLLTSSLAARHDLELRPNGNCVNSMDWSLRRLSQHGGAREGDAPSPRRPAFADDRNPGHARRDLIHAGCCWLRVGQRRGRTCNAERRPRRGCSKPSDQQSPSAREVSSDLTSSGYSVHFTEKFKTRVKSLRTLSQSHL